MHAALIAAVSVFLQTFGGSWTCMRDVPASGAAPARTVKTAWTIAADPGVENWAVVHWGGSGAEGGTAYVGYVAPLKQWIYDDFHGDGTYARSTTPAPNGNTWDWYGTYYAPDSQISYGPISWKLTGPSRIDRTYAKTGTDGKVTVLATDYCTKN